MISCPQNPKNCKSAAKIFTIFKQLLFANVISVYNFAPGMKKIAAILLFLFALVQVGPAVTALFSPSTVVFMVDEEKGDEKIEETKKTKKEIPFVTHQSIEFSHQINIALHVAEKIQAPPCLEKLKPPPNFC
jgi:hypothetical protein